MAARRGSGGGRRPKPGVMKILAGVPGKRPVRGMSWGAPQRHIPHPPKVVKGKARSAWRRLAPKLYAAGLLRNLDVEALACLCVLWSRFEEAQEKVETFGLVMTAPSGVMYPSPFAVIVRQSIKDMKSYLIEFGITPSSATKILGTDDVPALTRDDAAEYAAMFGTRARGQA